jgi:hypothetical protein
MNPRETQAGGSARDHLSAIEAHIKGRPLDPAFPDYSGCVDPPVSPRGLVRKVTENMVSPSRRSYAPLPALNRRSRTRRELGSK